MKRLLLTRDFPGPSETLDPFFEVTRRTRSPLSPEDARVALGDFDAILCTIGDAFPAEVFGGAPRCGMIANFGVGYNHIDTEAACAAGITVSNTPDTVTDATADIALTLMLMTARRASEGERVVRAGGWPGWAPDQFLGTHLTGKRLGIVGMGRIGQAVARRAHFGFEMPVIYHNRSRKEVEVPARQVDDLQSLMSQSDVVVVTVPGSPETRHLIDAEALSQMNDGAIFVNVSRGDVVDEAALIAELASGRVSAGLDVYEHEPEVPDALIALENVTLLPHLGTAAVEVRAAMGKMAMDNLIAWAEGRTPPNIV